MSDRAASIREAKSVVERVMADTSAGYAAIDTDGRILACNDAFAAILGLTINELVNANLVSFFRDAFRDLAQNWLTDAMAGKQVVLRQLVGLLHTSGETRMVDLNASIVRDPDGSMTCVVLAGWDITDILARWSITKDQKKLLALALEVNEIGTWERDHDTESFRMDATAERLFGYDEGTYPRHSFADHLARHRALEVDKSLREALDALVPAQERTENGAVSVRILRVPRRDGTPVWMRIGKRRTDHPVIVGAMTTIGTVQNIDKEINAFIDLWETQRALERSTMLIKAATDASSIGLWRVGLQANECWFSDSYFTALGYEPDEIDVNLHAFTDLLHPDDVDKVMSTFESSIRENNGQYAGDFRLRRKDGSYAWIGSAGQLVQDETVEGGVAMVGAQIDISDRVQANDRIERPAADTHATLERLTHLTENVPGGIYELHMDADGSFSYPFVTKGFADLVGTSVENLKRNPRSAFENVHPDDRKGIAHSIINSAKKLSTWKHTSRFNHPKYGLIWLRGTSTPVRRGDGSTHWFGCLLDVTEEVVRERELEKARHLTELQSLRDPLTNLPNRRAFDNAMMERYNNRRVKSRRHTIIRIDLDHFKFVNDTLGHAAGDAVLGHVAEILRKSTRESDISARVGGDEFVVFLAPEQTTDDAMQVIERIRDLVKKPFVFNGRHCRFDASFGVASSAPLPEDPSELLSFADAALYEAKRAGRGRVMVFTPELHSELKRVRLRADQIQEGLEKGQFVPFFQPQIDAQTGRISGCEVLARWQHPEDGLIPPDEFIPVAEQIRVVQDIDRAVFMRALDALERFRAQSLDMPKMSFNVSAGRILDPDIIRSVRMLQTHGTRVAFELLESILLEEEGAVFEHHLDMLKECGIDIEVDDFGSGRASIIGVMRVAPKAIKIDKRLVLPMVQDSNLRDMVRAIVDISRTLKVDVIAEGVETFEHADLLRKMGCNTLQGFAFARALPENDLIEYLRQYDPFALFERQGKSA